MEKRGIIMILNLMKKKFAPLIFSLFCGLVYFGLAYVLVLNYTKTGGAFLAFSFAPAITFGSALIILKAINMYIEANTVNKLNFLCISHIFLAVISVTLVLGTIF